MKDANSPEEAPKPLTGRQAYNLVTDTIGGPNVRLWDNLVQGLIILAFVALGGLIGALVAQERALGALVGGFAGLIAGTLISGLFLMIYRMVRHARGKHD